MPVSLPEPLPGDNGWLETPAGRLRWYASGHGAPVLLLHSFNAAGSAFEVRPLYRELAKTRRAIAFDWPGFGRSDRPDLAYDAELYEDVLDAVVAAVATGQIGDEVPEQLPVRLDVVSLSLPSQYAVELAAAEPERFGRLALVSPTGFGRFGGRAGRGGRVAWQVLRGTGIGRLLFAVLARRRVIELFLRQIFADPAAVPRPVVEYAWRTAQQPGAEYGPLRFICGQLDDPGAEAAYRELGVPALLVFGASPRFCDPKAGAALTDANPQLRFVEIAGSGDLPQWEQPEAAFAAIRGFLEA